MLRERCPSALSVCDSKTEIRMHEARKDRGFLHGRCVTHRINDGKNEGGVD